MLPVELRQVPGEAPVELAGVLAEMRELIENQRDSIDRILWRLDQTARQRDQESTLLKDLTQMLVGLAALMGQPRTTESRIDETRVDAPLPEPGAGLRAGEPDGRAVQMAPRQWPPRQWSGPGGVTASILTLAFLSELRVVPGAQWPEIWTQLDNTVQRCALEELYVQAVRAEGGPDRGLALLLTWFKDYAEREPRPVAEKTPYNLLMTPEYCRSGIDVGPPEEWPTVDSIKEMWHRSTSS